MRNRFGYSNMKNCTNTSPTEIHKELSGNRKEISYNEIILS